MFYLIKPSFAKLTYFCFGSKLTLSFWVCVWSCNL